MKPTTLTDQENIAHAGAFLKAWVTNNFPDSNPKVSFGVFQETGQESFLVLYNHKSAEHDGTLSRDRMIEALEKRLPNVSIEPCECSGCLGFAVECTPQVLADDIGLRRAPNTSRKAGR